MSIYMRASCTGSLTGVFSGSLAFAPTASYRNTADGTGVCTGSLLVSEYLSSSAGGSATYQRIHAFLDDASGDGAWTYVASQPGCYEESNTGAITTSIYPNETYASHKVIFVDAGQSANHVAYTLPSATAFKGYELTFVATANANASAQFGITGSSNQLHVLFQCDGGVFSQTGKTSMAFQQGKFSQNTRITCRSNGDSWFLDGSTDQDNSKMYTN
jgi:hypothetical protein